MAEAIRMPLLSDTMKEGVIAEWHKKVGDKVKSDDVLAEVETDKATMEVTGYVEGTLLYVGVKKGEAAKVNDIIAIIGKPGEDFQSLLDKEKQNNNKSANKAPEEKKETTEKTPVPKNDAAVKEALKNATVIRMPLLSDTMKEGKIVAWHKKVGDKVKSDDVLAEVETDKATMEVIGYADGTLLYIGTKEGEAAKVNDIIAIVGKEGTNFQAILDAEQGGATEQSVKKEEHQVAATQETQNIISTNTNGRIKASPLAKKLAADKGIDLSAIKGSGDDGRIIKRDIDNYTPQAAASPTTTPAFTPIAGQESHTDVPNSQMRKTIARRLSESKYTSPHFYLSIEVNMDVATEARKAINEMIAPAKVSFNDFVIKAAAMALRKHPEINSSWMGDFIRINHHIHIGSAVAVEDGLIVPVIRFADQKSLAQIAAETKALNEKAKNKKLQPQDFTGNTFTISNLGMLDIEEFTAIINPPDSCILAVGRIKPAPIVENNQIKIANIMKLTMSCDHRVVDGAVGARFLQTLKKMLENPVTMLV